MPLMPGQSGIFSMKTENQHNLTGFSILGLTDTPQLQLPLFIIFLVLYFLIICGNSTIFLIILWDPRLHTPMYVFLVNLAFVDITYTSCILPKLLKMLITQNKAISFLGCIIQMYFFIFLACTEILLLVAMAYDRYLAICHPLRYFILLSFRHCAILIMIAWTISFLSPVGHAALISQMSFCASHIINHFFCDMTPLLKLSCSDTFTVELLNYVEGTILGFFTFLLTVISYVFIIANILKIKSKEGRLKAFSTCTSHLTCITVYYGTIVCLYVRPISSYSPKQDKFFSLLYIVLVPMVNPVIYSLKNQDVKDALKKLKDKMQF
ncbi:olfactory receptor 1019-like [Spea bombifrons]|uniref:olfactory receptor 1019-like n=1 Tax=Spea bombifrons TaxID=233779 RepID=UPI00234ACD28|nr:olfactory receptor 1019-like [Spea bombifrons]